MTNPLKACPWCGKQPKMDSSIKGAEPVFSCCVTEYMSKEQWNTRATPPIDREKLLLTVQDGVCDFMVNDGEIRYIQHPRGKKRTLINVITDKIINALPELGK